MNNIEKNICKAIDIIVNKAMADASYDKTIQATVVSCVDATIGKYKIKYQDSTFYAYSGSSDVTYSNGANVYVLVPGNDMSKDKTILGTTKRLGINYAPSAVGDEQYEVNGKNIVTSSGEFGLSSYRYGDDGTYVKLLYDADEPSNLINIDQTAVTQYIKQSGSVICGGVVRTVLPAEQRYKGNFGIIFAIDFKNNGTEETVTRTYVVDVNKMTGNPYKLVNATRQYGIFDIDGENFVRINYVAIFTRDFPHTKPDDECENDIFISNIELCGAIRLSNEDLTGYSLSFITLQGTYFIPQDASNRELTLDAQVRVKGKVVDNSSQQLDFYWFVEHAGVTSQSVYYNQYGGQGWKCLNDYNVIDKDERGNPVTVEWVPGSYRYAVKKSDIVAKNVTYKCAVVYDGTVISKEIVITNLGSNYEITIVSDSGDQFYFDNGRPMLTCLVNNAEMLGYEYAWSVTNNAGNFESLVETSELNDSYNSLVSQYNALINAINAETAAYTPNESRLVELQSAIAAFNTTQRVEANKIYCLNVSAITNYSTYTCTVYNGGVYLGTSSIVIKNTYSVEGVYSLAIENGTQVYKYDESGNAPNHGSKLNPLIIPALAIKLYDNNGNRITDDILTHCDIKWVVPTQNTMVQIPSSLIPIDVDLVGGTATYGGINLPYEIKSKYNINYQRNDIELIINYKGSILTAKTDITFTKEGEPGTNGTEFTCRIVPNVRDGVEPPAYPMVSESYGAVVTWNFNPAQSGKYFKAQLWHNDNQIFSNTESGNTIEGKFATVVWSILSNKYYDTNKDESSFAVNAATGVISGGRYHNVTVNGVRKAPVNILCAAITYDGITYYATLPIVTTKAYNDSYRVKLKSGTGFDHAIYTSDGRTPSYDTTNPFEIIVERNLGNNQWEDVSLKETAAYKVDYRWTYLGSVYAGNAWQNAINLEDKRIIGTVAANQKWIKPKDTYNGQCLSNAVECSILYSGNEVCRIHLPIHLLLNQYGHSALNGWNGNSIQLDDLGGFVLAPQVGAGRKENDNSFTGLLMGEVKEGANSKSDVGLLGYYRGARTVFIDSETGKAEFGMNGNGKIIIDPTINRALLYSGNYNLNRPTEGLLIDLTTPEIRFGNGNFVVTSDGHMTAKGGGQIAGWNIDNDSLFTSYKLDSNNVRISSSDFQRSINGVSNDTLRMAFGTKFGVTSNGTMYAGDAIIGTGVNKITIGKGDNNNSALYSGNKNAYAANGSGFYLGTDGIALGAYNGHNSPFQVDYLGNLYARAGTIAGWRITDISLSRGDKTTYNDDNSGIYLGSEGIGLGANFRVSNAGDITAKSGAIAGWKIVGNNLQNADGSVYVGPGGLKVGDNFSVDSNGILVATSASLSGTINSSQGHIGGWTINASTLTGGKMTLNSNGSMSGSNWSIGTDGKANFSNMNISGGLITGGSRTGGSISMGGGSWNSDGVGLSSGQTSVDGKGLPFYVDELITKKITADYINGLIAKIDAINAIAVRTGSLVIRDPSNQRDEYVILSSGGISLRAGAGLSSNGNLNITAAGTISLNGTNVNDFVTGDVDGVIVSGERRKSLSSNTITVCTGTDAEGKNTYSSITYIIGFH